MFLLPAKTPRLWLTAVRRKVLWRKVLWRKVLWRKVRAWRRHAGHPALAHAICLSWMLLLLPLAACVAAAWLAATLLTLLWAVLVAPFRRSDSATLD